MAPSTSGYDPLTPANVRLRPASVRRALAAGLAGGGFSSAGFGFAWIGVPQVASGGGATSWLFAGIGLVSVVLAFVIAGRLLRWHHRGAKVAGLSMLLAGLPLAPLAPAIAATVILGLATPGGTVAAPAPAAVLAASWLALAVPGIVLGPLATWWVAHLNRFLPNELAVDEATVARYEAATVR